MKILIFISLFLAAPYFSLASVNTQTKPLLEEYDISPENMPPVDQMVGLPLSDSEDEIQLAHSELDYYYFPHSHPPTVIVTIPNIVVTPLPVPIVVTPPPVVVSPNLGQVCRSQNSLFFCYMPRLRLIGSACSCQDLLFNHNWFHGYVNNF